MAQSQERLVNIPQAGENESMKSVALLAAEIDEFFSDEMVANKKELTQSKVLLASFEIGVFKPEEIKWEIQEDKVIVKGQKKASTNRSILGSRFTRCIAIPQDISADSVTTRFSVRDGVLLVEGCKKKIKSRKIQRQAFFSDSHFSLSFDIGDEKHDSRITSGQADKTVELF